MGLSSRQNTERRNPACTFEPSFPIYWNVRKQLHTSPSPPSVMDYNLTHNPEQIFSILSCFCQFCSEVSYVWFGPSNRTEGEIWPCSTAQVWHLGRKMASPYHLPISPGSWRLEPTYSASGIYPKMRPEPTVKTAHNQTSIQMQEIPTQNNSNKHSTLGNHPTEIEESIKSKTQKILQV